MRAPWVTAREARQMTGRSARTIRRWVLDGLIETRVADDGRTKLLRTTDLMRTEAGKSDYIVSPSFGRREREDVR